MILSALILSAALMCCQSDVAYQVSDPVTQQVVAVDYGTCDTYKNRWEVTLTEEEIDVLAKILWLEARGEDDLGQQLVVITVLNRIQDGRFGDGLMGVLSAPGQFSTWRNRDSAKPTPREYNNILAVLHGQVDSGIYFAPFLYFNSAGNGVKIGGHYFR